MARGEPSRRSMIEFECEDCHIDVVMITAGEMPPVGERVCKRVCMVCAFIREQPEEDRAELKNRLHHEPSILCPRCGSRSYHPKDIEERYCGKCHEWHAQMS